MSEYVCDACYRAERDGLVCVCVCVCVCVIIQNDTILAMLVHRLFYHYDENTGSVIANDRLLTPPPILCYHLFKCADVPGGALSPDCLNCPHTHFPSPPLLLTVF
eukprot:Tamp_32113.p2 GENE.Tamp_32113~~Tamp_32113.p2  ORF type:complete len:105 (+),score=6.11 Tamp_32113:293-607(+)